MKHVTTDELYAVFGGVAPIVPFLAGMFLLGVACGAKSNEDRQN